MAWEGLGWEACGFSEIEPFPSAVLGHHYPGVLNLGDLTQYHDWPTTLRPDLIVGGTPCQSFSVAGLRQGLADPRGNLTLVFLGLLKRERPRWVVWENVPGVLSDQSGAFGAFLGGLGELGYGFAYRVLDAQYYGVAQRRRRVFVVGYLGDWRRAAAVLFEPESLRGDPAPGRGAGQKPAPCLSARTKGGGGLGTDFECDGGLIPETAHTLRGEGFDASEDGTGRGTPLVAAFSGRARGDDGRGYDRAPQVFENGVVGALDTMKPHCVAFDTTQVTSKANYSNPKEGDPCHPLASGAHPPAVAFNMHKSGNEGSSMGVAQERTDCLRAFEKSPFAVMHGAAAVRRLTPVECERLQGFPDGYTQVPVRGKPAADGPRYKALGNSMAVPVMRWIGERIALVEKDSGFSGPGEEKIPALSPEP